VTAVPLLVAPPGLLTSMRPRQWAKNVLVLAPLLPAARALDVDALTGAGVAFLMFCAASSAVYLGNDVCDREADRAHPVKCARPIACGVVTPTQALSAAGVLLLVAIALALSRGPQLLLVLLVYLGVQAAYCLRLKHEPVLELASVTSGFLLRAIAGGVATGIPLSQWFLLVAAFGSFFMIAGKRYSELKSVGADAGTRRSLTRYSESYLRFAWMLAATMVLISYSLWAFTNGGVGAYAVPWTAISIAPFTLGLLQYALEVDSGNAGEPEEVVLHDRVLQVLGLVWVVVISIGVFTR